MKHLKTFEQHQFNQEDELNEGIFDKARKFATGWESKEDRDEKVHAVKNQLDEIEAEVAKNPEKWSFNRQQVESKAKENNYRGEIRTQKGGNDTSRTYVVWDNKASGFEKIATGATYAHGRG